MRSLQNLIASFRPLPVPKVSPPPADSRSAALIERAQGDWPSARLNAEGNVTLATGRVMTEAGAKELIRRARQYDFR